MFLRARQLRNPLTIPRFDTLALQDGALVLLKFDEAQAPIINHGRATGLTITASNVTFGADGLPALGGTSVDFNNALSMVTINNNAQINSLRAFSYIGLMNADTAGGGTGGRWFHWNNTSVDETLASLKTTGFYEARVERQTVDATYNSDINEITYPTGNMMLVLGYDESVGIELYQVFNGTLRRLTSGTNAIGSGTTAALAANLRIGNNNAVNRAFDGRMFRFGFLPIRFTPKRVLQYARAARLM